MRRRIIKEAWQVLQLYAFVAFYVMLYMATFQLLCHPHPSVMP